MFGKHKPIPQFEPLIRLRHAIPVVKTIYSGWVGPGHEVTSFEADVRKFVEGFEPYNASCVATVSGTTAIATILQAAKIPLGSTVIFPSYTCPAGANVALLLGYKVRLVDIDYQTGCLDIRHLDFRPDDSVLIYVNHNGGGENQRLEISQMCNAAGVFMLEDSSQALGASSAGLFGRAGVFSFSVPKIVTCGQGGMIVTLSADFAEKCRGVIDHGGSAWRKLRLWHNPGGNSRMTNMAAAFGRAQFRELPWRLKRRASVLSWYQNCGLMIDEVEGAKSPWMMCYRTKYATQVQAALAAHKIEASRYYTPLLRSPLYDHCDSTPNGCPAAEALYAELLYLPSSLILTRRQVRRICGIIKEEEKRCRLNENGL